MAEWGARLLRDITSKIGSGATPRGGSAVYRGAGVALIRSQNVLDNAFSMEGLAFIDEMAAEQLKGVTVEPGDVLINITGDSVLRCCLVPESVLPARVNQHVSIIRSDGSFIPKFMQATLVNPVMKDYMLSLASGGATRNAITKAQLSSLEIPLPGLHEQRAIADVLSALDDKIAANTKLATTADELALVLASSFVPNVALGDVARQSKALIDPAGIDDELVHHYSLPAYDSGQAPDVVAPSTIKSNKFLVTAPGVLASKLNPRFPRVWNLAQLQPGLSLASTEYVVLASDYCSSSILWSLISQPRFGAQLEGMVAGTSGSHQRVKPIEMLAVEVPDPRGISFEDRGAIEGLALRAIAGRAESRRLAAIRDALLPALMSGRLTVRDAEGAVASAGDGGDVEPDAVASGKLW